VASLVNQPMEARDERREFAANSPAEMM